MLSSAVSLSITQFKLQKKAAVSSGATLAPDQRVSKNFTFRVKGEESPRTKKRRTRKPDPEDEDESESEK